MKKFEDGNAKEQIMAIHKRFRDVKYWQAIKRTAPPYTIGKYLKGMDMYFDEDGKVIGQGDYFDFGGMINAVYPKNLVFIQVAVKKGKKDEMIKLLKSERGIPTTVAYDGAIRYEMAYNDETNTVHLVGEWENYEKYAEYLNWRMTEDDFIQQMIPLMDGGANGLTVSQPNSSYTSF